MNAKTAKTKTPDLILDNAQELMLNDGYHGVSVDKIIERTGISKGTFFYHFGSKDVLAEQLLRRFFDHQGNNLVALMEHAKAQQNDPLAALLFFLKAFPQQFHDSKGCIMAAFSYQLIKEQQPLRAICQEAIRSWEEFFTGYIDDALRFAKPSSTVSAKALSRMLFCIMEGALIIERVEQSREMQQQFSLFAHYIQLLTQTDAQ